MRCCESGTCSDGFRMNVLPHATANGRNQSGTIAGKLNGAITAQTPTGWRITWQSRPGATFSSPYPINKEGAPHVKLYQVVYPGMPLPGDARAHLLALGRRLDLMIEVSRYGKGKFSLSLAP